MREEDLAWAAGFFDAEGSTALSRNRPQRTPKFRCGISQTGPELCPETLHKFREAVRVGSIRGPSKLGVFYWTTDTFGDSALAISAIWPWLGTAKRKQFIACARRLQAYQRLRLARTTNPRSLRLIASFVVSWPRFARWNDVRNDAHEIEWAAGLFDGEGSVSLKRRVWKDKTFYVITAGVPQGGRMEVPDVLLRFQRAVRMGAIYGPGRWRNANLRSYDWHLTQPEHVRQLVRLLSPLLGARKRAQAAASFAVYDSRPHRAVKGRRIGGSSARWLSEAAPQTASR